MKTYYELRIGDLDYDVEMKVGPVTEKQKELQHAAIAAWKKTA